MTVINFNFANLKSEGLDFNFGEHYTSVYVDFNFIESGYVASYNFNFGIEVNTYSILKGTSNNFSSVWILNNKMYVASSDTLTVVDLLTNTVHDWYSQTQVGRAGESLDSDDVIDIVVG